MRRILIISLFLVLAPTCSAQATQDYFYGRTDVPAPKIHPHRFAASCSQSTTTVTCTPTNFVSATQFYQDANITNWTVVLSSPSLTFHAAGCGSPGFTNCSTTGYEAFAIDGTSTAMDWNPAACPSVSNATQCALHLTSVNTSTGAFTLISPVSQTVGATNGFLRPAYTSVQSGISTPFGTGTMFSDPLGNWVWPVGSNGLCVAGCSNSHDTSTSLGETFHTILTNKYGSDCNAAQFETQDMLAAYAFASFDDGDNVYAANANSGCGAQFKPLYIFPGLTLQQPDAFDLDENRFAFAAQPPQDLRFLLTQSLSIGLVHGDISYMSPYASNYVTGYWTSTGTNGDFTGKQKLYAMPMDGLDEMSDIDWTNIVDPGQYWPNVEFGSPSVDPGWIVAISQLHASHEQANSQLVYSPFHMTDDLNYEKKLSASAPSGCYAPFSFTSASGGSFGPSFTACPWGDLVRNYFNNSVTAMNTAFSPTSFTSFGTSETTVSAETVCAAGVGAGQCGNAASLSYTLVHTTPTPGSIHILVTIGATTVEVAGDCWKQVTNCASSASDNSTATFAGEGANQGMIVNNKAWQANRAIPANWCLVDSSNNYECNLGTAGITGASAPTWTTTTTSDNGMTWTYFGPIISHGSTSNITYSGVGAGTIALAFSATPPSTESITVNYTFGGAGAGGTGLLDELGADTALVGTNPVAMLTPATWASATAYGPFTNDCDEAVDAGKSCGVINIESSLSGFWAVQTNPSGCTSSNTQPTWTGPMGTEFDEGTGPCKWIVYQCVAGATGCWQTNVINANATFALLAHLFSYERSFSYVNLYWNLHNKYWPDWLFAFPNGLYLGVRKEFLQTAQQQGENVVTVNGNGFLLCGASCGQGVTRPMDVYELAAIQNLFSGTYMTEAFAASIQNEQGDPCVSGSNSFSNCYNTLSSLAAGYFAAVSNSLNLHGNFPSLFPTQNLGARAFGSALHDIQNNGFQLFKTYRDNRTDGVEDVSGAVTCANGKSCGGEATGIGTLCSGSPCWVTPWGYNAWGGANGLVAANKLWLLGTAPATSGPATKSIMMARIIDPAWIAAETHYTGGEKR